MSAPVVLGVLGTVLSTVTLIPHVVHALRSGAPGGSPLGWALSFGGSTVWGVYGLAAHDFIEAAPGLVTVPCGLLLAAWSIRNHVRRPVAAASPGAESPITEAMVAAAAGAIQPAVEVSAATTELPATTELVAAA